MLLPDHEDVYAYTRTSEDETLLVVCNVSATPHGLADLLPEAVGAEVVLGNRDHLPDHDPAVLGPWDARILRLR